MGPTLAPKETGSHCRLALQSWPQAGPRRPGPRCGGSWHGLQEVQGLDRVSACGNLLFPFYSSRPSRNRCDSETQSLLVSPPAVIRHSLASEVELTEVVASLLQFLFYFSFHLILAFRIDPEILLFYSWEIRMCPQVHNRCSVGFRLCFTGPQHGALC